MCIYIFIQRGEIDLEDGLRAEVHVLNEPAQPNRDRFTICLSLSCFLSLFLALSLSLYPSFSLPVSVYLCVNICT